MSYQLYHQSIEGATLTYSATATTNYPETNLQDRYLNTYFMDAPAGNVTLKIDFGATRACDYLILGKFYASGSGSLRYDLHYGTADNGTDFENAALADKALTAAYVTYYEAITSQTKRYWRLTFESSGGTLQDIRGAVIYLGTKITLSHSPELDVAQSADYLVNVNQGVGGIRSGSIDNTTVRRLWSYPWKLLSETDKTNLQTFRDSVYMNKDLSRYPFWWSPDTGTTLYYARTKGALDMKQQAYQAWTWDANFEEEL